MSWRTSLAFFHFSSKFERETYLCLIEAVYNSSFMLNFTVTRVELVFVVFNAILGIKNFESSIRFYKKIIYLFFYFIFLNEQFVSFELISSTVVFMFAYTTMNFKNAKNIAVDQILLLHHAEKNYTKLKKKICSFLKTKIGSFCATRNITGYPCWGSSLDFWAKWIVLYHHPIFSNFPIRVFPIFPWDCIHCSCFVQVQT